MNNALIHPHTAHIVTAGIERDILLHSPTPSSTCTQDLARTELDVRALPPPAADDNARYLRALFGSHPTMPLEEGSLEAEAQAQAEAGLDRETIQLFDQLSLRASLTIVSGASGLTGVCLLL